MVMAVIAVQAAGRDAGQTVEQCVDLERFRAGRDPGAVLTHVEVQQDVYGYVGALRCRRQRLGRTRIVYHAAEGSIGITTGEVDQPFDIGPDHLVGDEDILHANLRQHPRLVNRGALEFVDPGRALHLDDGPHLVGLYVGPQALGAAGNLQGPIDVLLEPLPVDQHGRTRNLIDVGYEVSGIHGCSLPGVYPARRPRGPRDRTLTRAAGPTVCLGCWSGLCPYLRPTAASLSPRYPTRIRPCRRARRRSGRVG